MEGKLRSKIKSSDGTIPLQTEKDLSSLDSLLQVNL